MSLYELFKPKGPSGFGYGSTAEEVTAADATGNRTSATTIVTTAKASTLK